MKKFLTGLLVLLCMAALTGCGKNDISLTNEENDLVAEYIAGTLLKYSYDNEWKYQKLNTAQKTCVTTTAGTNSSTQTPSQSQSVNSHKSSASASASNAAGTASTDLMGNLPAVLGLNGVTVRYKDYVTGSAYPLDDYVSVPAQQGYKVVAVELTLTNTSGQAVTLNSSGNVTFRLEVGGTGVGNYASILKNDITALKNVSLAAGASKDVVVLFQVKESDASLVAGSSMTATSSGTSLGSLTIN